MRSIFIYIIFVLIQSALANNQRKYSFLESLHCGQDNCYEILNVTQNADKNDIKKAFRQLSIKYHPDRNHSPEAREIFIKITRAYEQLVDDRKRQAYDYFLKYPDSYYNWYFGIHEVYISRIHPGYIFASILVFGSIIQWINRRWRRQWFISYIKNTQQYKTKLNTLIQERYKTKFKKEDVDTRKKILKELEDEILNNVEIDGKTISSNEPLFKISEIFAIRCLLLPVIIIKYILTSLRWIILFRLLKFEYDAAAKEYLVYSGLGLTHTEWLTLPEEERKEKMKLELWKPEQLNAYLEEQNEIERQKRMSQGRYRQWRRLQKKGTFIL